MHMFIRGYVQVVVFFERIQRPIHHSKITLFYLLFAAGRFLFVLCVANMVKEYQFVFFPLRYKGKRSSSHNINNCPHLDN